MCGGEGLRELWGSELTAVRTVGTCKCDEQSRADSCQRGSGAMGTVTMLYAGPKFQAAARYSGAGMKFCARIPPQSDLGEVWMGDDRLCGQGWCIGGYETIWAW